MGPSVIPALTGGDGVLNKLAGKASLYQKLCVQPRDPASVNTVESDQGKFSLPTSAMCTLTSVQYTYIHM